MANADAPQPSQVEIVDETTVFADFFTITEAHLRHELYAGGLSAPLRRLKVDRGQSVAAVLLRQPERVVLLVEQFKYPTLGVDNGWILELPAGVVEPGEAPMASMHRELREEVGYDPPTLTQIGDFYVSPGGSTERIALYFAEVDDVCRVAGGGGGGGVRGEGEDIRTVEVPADDIDGLIESGAIRDAKTLIGLMWLRHRSLVG